MHVNELHTTHMPPCHVSKIHMYWKTNGISTASCFGRQWRKEASRLSVRYDTLMCSYRQAWPACLWRVDWATCCVLTIWKRALTRLYNGVCFFASVVALNTHRQYQVLQSSWHQIVSICQYWQRQLLWQKWKKNSVVKRTTSLSNGGMCNALGTIPRHKQAHQACRTRACCISQTVWTPTSLVTPIDAGQVNLKAIRLK